MEKTKSLIMGLWKFNENERVKNEDIIALAKELASDDKYTQLYVRKVSKDQIGLGFAYAGDGTKEAHDSYFDATSDQLKRRFGNDLVGWDIASTSTLIKGF